jgi:hypothetical protein
MDELIEKMATVMSPALWSSGKPDSEVGPGTRDARNRLRRNARAVLRVLAEHGDTQQVREQVIRILSTSRAGLSVDALDAIMAVVAPRLAAAVEREQNLHQVVTEWHDRAERAEADLAAAQMQVRVRDARLDQVRRLPEAWAENSARHFSRELEHSVKIPDIEFARGFSGGWNHAAGLLRGVLDAPARHDESEQSK